MFSPIQLEFACLPYFVVASDCLFCSNKKQIVLYVLRILRWSKIGTST